MAQVAKGQFPSPGGEEQAEGVLPPDKGEVQARLRLEQLSWYRFRHGSALSSFSWYRGIRADCEVGYRRPSAPTLVLYFPLPSCRLHRNDQEKRWCGLITDPTNIDNPRLGPTSGPLAQFLSNHKDALHEMGRLVSTPLRVRWQDSQDLLAVEMAMHLHALSTMRRPLHALARKLLGEVRWLNAKLKAGRIDKNSYYDSLTKLIGGVPRVLKNAWFTGFSWGWHFRPCSSEVLCWLRFNCAEISALRRFSITLGHHQLIIQQTLSNSDDSICVDVGCHIVSSPIFAAA